MREKNKEKRKGEKEDGKEGGGKKEGCFQFALSNITLNYIY